MSKGQKIFMKLALWEAMYGVAGWIAFFEETHGLSFVGAFISGALMMAALGDCVIALHAHIRELEAEAQS